MYVNVVLLVFLERKQKQITWTAVVLQTFMLSLSLFIWYFPSLQHPTFATVLCYVRDSSTYIKPKGGNQARLVTSKAGSDQSVFVKWAVSVSLFALQSVLLANKYYATANYSWDLPYLKRLLIQGGAWKGKLPGNASFDLAFKRQNTPSV